MDEWMVSWSNGIVVLRSNEVMVLLNNEIMVSLTEVMKGWYF